MARSYGVVKLLDMFATASITRTKKTFWIDVRKNLNFTSNGKECVDSASCRTLVFDD